MENNTEFTILPEADDGHKSEVKNSANLWPDDGQEEEKELSEETDSEKVPRRFPKIIIPAAVLIIVAALGFYAYNSFFKRNSQVSVLKGPGGPASFVKSSNTGVEQGLINSKPVPAAPVGKTVLSQTSVVSGDIPEKQIASETETKKKPLAAAPAELNASPVLALPKYTGFPKMKTIVSLDGKIALAQKKLRLKELMRELNNKVPAINGGGIPSGKSAQAVKKLIALGPGFAMVDLNGQVVMFRPGEYISGYECLLIGDSSVTLIYKGKTTKLYLSE